MYFQTLSSQNENYFLEFVSLFERLLWPSLHPRAGRWLLVGERLRLLWRRPAQVDRRVGRRRLRLLVCRHGGLHPLHLQLGDARLLGEAEEGRRGRGAPLQRHRCLRLCGQLAPDDHVICLWREWGVSCVTDYICGRTVLGFKIFGRGMASFFNC